MIYIYFFHPPNAVFQFSCPPFFLTIFKMCSRHEDAKDWEERDKENPKTAAKTKRKAAPMLDFPIFLEQENPKKILRALRSTQTRR